VIKLLGRWLAKFVGDRLLCRWLMGGQVGGRRVAKLVEDGWPRWEMGGQVGGRWVAKLVGDG
jgi:hypothetical protein